MGLEGAGADGGMSQAAVMLEPKLAKRGLVFSMILFACLGMPRATLLSAKPGQDPLPSHSVLP